MGIRTMTTMMTRMMLMMLMMMLRTMAKMVSTKCNVPTVLLDFKLKHTEIQARAKIENKTKGTKEEQQKRTHPENP